MGSTKMRKWGLLASLAVIDILFLTGCFGVIGSPATMYELRSNGVGGLPDPGVVTGSGPVASPTPIPAPTSQFVATRECAPISISQNFTSPPQAAPPSLGFGVSFLSNWVQDATAGGWQRTEVLDDCRMRADGTKTWHGLTATRVEVNPGDDPLNLNENTERADVEIMQNSDGTPADEDNSSGDVFIATSYYFPSTWDGTQLPWSELGSGCSSNPMSCNSWSVILELNPPDNIGGPGPAFALSAARQTSGGPELFSVAVQAGDMSTCCGTSYPFSDGGQIQLGQWVDLVFEFVFTSQANGHLAIWRRNEGQTAFTQEVNVYNIATLQYNSKVTTAVGPHYWKQGLYRGGDVNGRTDVLWIGPTVRGNSFSAVESAAFGTSNGP